MVRHLDQFSQQSHTSAPTDVWAIVLISFIGYFHF